MFSAPLSFPSFWDCNKSNRFLSQSHRPPILRSLSSSLFSLRCSGPMTSASSVFPLSSPFCCPAIHRVFVSITLFSSKFPCASLYPVFFFWHFIFSFVSNITNGSGPHTLILAVCKSLPSHTSICDISVLLSVVFSHSNGDFPTSSWHIISNWSLNIMGFMLWDSGSDLSLLLQQVSNDHVPANSCFCQVDRKEGDGSQGLGSASTDPGWGTPHCCWGEPRLKRYLL